MKNKLLLGLIALLMFCCHVQAQHLKLLVCSKTNGFRHKSIPAAKEALTNLAKENNWDITFTEDSLSFSDYNYLKHFDAVIFVMATGKIFDSIQEISFEKYIEKGGGLVTLHTGTDCEQHCDWYMKTIGAKFKAHPKQQQANFVVVDSTHPATRLLPKEWVALDELYNFAEPVSADEHTLIEVDETSYAGGTMNGKHPLVWCKQVKKGRIFQSALGHTDDFYKDPKMLQFIKGAILWAAKKG